MAGDLELTPLLIGLGVDELSVGAHLVAPVRSAIRSLSHAECSAMADQALEPPDQPPKSAPCPSTSPAAATPKCWTERS